MGTRDRQPWVLRISPKLGTRGRGASRRTNPTHLREEVVEVTLLLYEQLPDIVDLDATRGGEPSLRRAPLAPNLRHHGAGGCCAERPRAGAKDERESYE